MYGFYVPGKKVELVHNPFTEPIDVEQALKGSKKLFFKYLPSHAYISVLNDLAQTSKKERNQWQIIYLAVLGDEGSGKSVTIDALAQWFREFYLGRKSKYANFIYCCATARHLDKLYFSIPKGKKFIFIGCEDATGLITKEDIDVFNTKRRRWQCQAQTGFDAGVVVQVLGLHDWFAVHKLLRDSVSLVIAKSSKARLNQHDYSHQVLFMSHAGIKFTQKCAKYRSYVKNQKTKEKVKKALALYGQYFGFGTVWEKATKNIHVWYNPDIDVDLTTIYDFQYKRQGDEEIEQDEIYTVPEYHLTNEDILEWREPVLQALLTYPDKELSKYAKFFKAKYIDQLKPNSQLAWEVLELKTTQIYTKYKELENGQSRIGGLISKIRGALFEQHILALCEEKGIPATANPTITFEGYEYTDDIKIMDNIIINAKCGSGLRQYSREKKTSDSGKKVKGHYKATWVFAKNNYEAYILYYDLETDLVTMIDTESILSLEKINVGGNRKEFSQLTLSECLRRITARLTPLSPSPQPLPVRRSEKLGTGEKERAKGKEKEKAREGKAGEEGEEREKKGGKTVKEENIHVKEVC